jgi:hypothetical protein
MKRPSPVRLPDSDFRIDVRPRRVDTDYCALLSPSFLLVPLISLVHGYLGIIDRRIPPLWFYVQTPLLYLFLAPLLRSTTLLIV